MEEESLGSTIESNGGENGRYSNDFENQEDSGQYSQAGKSFDIVENALPSSDVPQENENEYDSEDFEAELEEEQSKDENKSHYSKYSEKFGDADASEGKLVLNDENLHSRTKNTSSKDTRTNTEEDAYSQFSNGKNLDSDVQYSSDEDIHSNTLLQAQRYNPPQDSFDQPSIDENQSHKPKFHVEKSADKHGNLPSMTIASGEAETSKNDTNKESKKNFLKGKISSRESNGEERRDQMDDKKQEDDLQSSLLSNDSKNLGESLLSKTEVDDVVTPKSGRSVETRKQIYKNPKHSSTFGLLFGTDDKRSDSDSSNSSAYSVVQSPNISKLEIRSANPDNPTVKLNKRPSVSDLLQSVLSSSFGSENSDLGSALPTGLHSDSPSHFLQLGKTSSAQSLLDKQKETATNVQVPHHQTSEKQQTNIMGNDTQDEPNSLASKKQQANIISNENLTQIPVLGGEPHISTPPPKRASADNSNLDAIQAIPNDKPEGDVTHEANLNGASPQVQHNQESKAEYGDDFDDASPRVEAKDHLRDEVPEYTLDFEAPSQRNEIDKKDTAPEYKVDFDESSPTAADAANLGTTPEYEVDFEDASPHPDSNGHQFGETKNPTTPNAYDADFENASPSLAEHKTQSVGDSPQKGPNDPSLQMNTNKVENAGEGERQLTSAGQEPLLDVASPEIAEGESPPKQQDPQEEEGILPEEPPCAEAQFAAKYFGQVNQLVHLKHSASQNLRKPQVPTFETKKEAPAAEESAPKAKKPGVPRFATKKSVPVVKSAPEVKKPEVPRFATKKAAPLVQLNPDEYPLIATIPPKTQAIWTKLAPVRQPAPPCPFSKKRLGQQPAEEESEDAQKTLLARLREMAVSHRRAILRSWERRMDEAWALHMLALERCRQRELERQKARKKLWGVGLSRPAWNQYIPGQSQQKLVRAKNLAADRHPLIHLKGGTDLEPLLSAARVEQKKLELMRNESLFRYDTRSKAAESSLFHAEFLHRGVTTMNPSSQLLRDHIRLQKVETEETHLLEGYSLDEKLQYQSEVQGSTAFLLCKMAAAKELDAARSYTHNPPSSSPKKQKQLSSPVRTKKRPKSAPLTRSKSASDQKGKARIKQRGRPGSAAPRRRSSGFVDRLRQDPARLNPQNQMNQEVNVLSDLLEEGQGKMMVDTKRGVRRKKKKMSPYCQICNARRSKKRFYVPSIDGERNMGQKGFFCSWTCVKTWNKQNTPIQQRYEIDVVIDILAEDVLNV